jgi:hypothetical protein
MVPPGPHRDLVEAAHRLYRQAGMPSTRTLSALSRVRHDLPDTVSHESVSAMLRGAILPSWAKLETLVRILAERAVGHPDVETTVVSIHTLWLLAVEFRSVELYLEDLRRRANAGDSEAAYELARRLKERGDINALRLQAERDWYAAAALALLLGERRDVKGLQERADAGDRDAAAVLNGLPMKKESPTERLNQLPRFDI